MQFDIAFDCRSSGWKFDFQLGHITFMEINHEIISTVILPILLLIQEGQLSVTDERMCTKYWLTGKRTKHA